MVGCSVLTRPSIISGKPVWSETSTTSHPLFAQQATGAAGREDFDTSLRECAGKINDTGFV